MADSDGVFESDTDLLIRVQQVFTKEVLKEIGKAFREAGQTPSPDVLDALGTVYGTSHQSIRDFWAKN